MRRKILLSSIVGAMLILLVGCGNVDADKYDSEENVVADGQESVENESQVELEKHKLYLDFSINANEELAEHKIDICVDAQEAVTVSEDPFLTYLCDVEEGQHVVNFLLDGENVPSASQVLDVNDNLCLKATIGYQDDEFTLGDVETSNSIADAMISYEDMSGLSLTDALSKLEAQHFVNVKYNADNESSIVNCDDWEVVSQSVTPGTVLDKTAPIELTCKQVYFQFYFDLAFDSNLFLATYDLDFYVDGKKIATIPHGEYYTYLMRAAVGDHEAVFYKTTDNSVKATKIFSVTNDGTFKARLHTNRNDIEINEFEILDSVTGASIEVPEVRWMTLDVAINKLAECGFSNVRGEPYSDIWDKTAWMVDSQDVAAGSSVDKNTKITLNCIRPSDFLSKNYLKLTIPEANKKASDLGNTIIFKDYLTNADMAKTISSMDATEKDLWIVKQASINSNVISLSLAYKGYVEMPNEVGNTLSTALSDMTSRKFSAACAEANDGSSIWDNNEWVVESQSIEAGKKVNANGKITFTCKRKETPTSSSSSKPSSEPTPKTEEVITIENNDDFADLMKTNNDDYKKILDFVSEHEGDIIQFDGTVAFMMHSRNPITNEEYKTRFDVLMVGGNYDDAQTYGPQFAFENVAFYNMNVVGTDTVAERMNFTIKGEIVGYDSSGNCILLEPVSMIERPDHPWYEDYKHK